MLEAGGAVRQPHRNPTGTRIGIRVTFLTPGTSRGTNGARPHATVPFSVS